MDEKKKSGDTVGESYRLKPKRKKERKKKRYGREKGLGIEWERVKDRNQEEKKEQKRKKKGMDQKNSPGI